MNNVYALLWALYGSGMLAMNVLAAKQIDIFGFTVTCGIFVSGLIFVAQDLMTELYGVKKSREMIFSCYGIVTALIVLFQFAIMVPPSVFWDNQTAFASVLRTTLRISIASFIAYGVGSVINTFIMSELKAKTNTGLLFRAVTSTLFGQFLDNGIFAFVAFVGVLPGSAIASMCIAGTVIEVITEIVCYPFLNIMVNRLSTAVEM